MELRVAPLWVRLLVVAAVGAVVAQEILLSSYTVDDAFISFRYARNLVEGNGLVFNVGERVEGYTNFLWTVALAGNIYLGGDPEAAAKALGILASLGTIYLVFRLSSLTRGEGSPWPLSLLAVAMLAANGAFVTSAITGLETSLFTFLVLAGAYVVIGEALVTGRRDSGVPAEAIKTERNPHPDPLPFRREREEVSSPAAREKGRFTLPPSALGGERVRVRAPRLRLTSLPCPLFFALAALARPEGVAVFGASLALKALSRNFQRDDLKVCARWAVAFAAIYAPYVVWRLGYYGDLLPNTFYAKTWAGPAQFYKGLIDLRDFSLTYYGVVFLLALALLARRRAPFWLTYVAGMAVTFALLHIYEGGDWIPFFRFLVPALPFYYLVIQEAMRHLYALLSSRASRRRVDLGFALASLALVGLTALPSFAMYGQLARAAKGQEMAHAALGRWLRDRAQGPVALMDIGRIGYISRLPIVDTSGLTDRAIAHSSGGLIDKRFDPAYVLNRQPQYFVLASTTDYLEAGGKPTDFPIEGRIYGDERFQERYAYRFTLDWGTVVDGKGYYLVVYERK